MLDPSNRVPLEETGLDTQAQKAAMLAKEQTLEKLLRAEDRLLDRVEAAETARRDSQQRSALVKNKVRTQPLPRGPVRHPSPRR